MLEVSSIYLAYITNNAIAGNFPKRNKNFCIHRNLCIDVDNSSFQNWQKLKTTPKPVNYGVDKQLMLHSQNRIQVSNGKIHQEGPPKMLC